MGTERRHAPRAVRRDAVALVDEVLVPELVEDPPPGLDVLVGISHIRIVHIDPERDALRQRFPVLHVAENAFLALLVELRDAVGLDVTFGGEIQFRLNGELHRQPMRVPAALAGHLVALHGLETGNDVLEDAGEDVMDAGRAISRRGALEEREDRTVLALLHGATKDVIVLPELQHVSLHVRKRDLAGYGLKGHQPSTCLLFLESFGLGKGPN